MPVTQLGELVLLKTGNSKKFWQTRLKLRSRPPFTGTIKACPLSKIAMPMIRHLYPVDWDEISAQVKTKARWRCQHCDRPCRKPGESLYQFEVRLGQEFPEQVESFLQRPHAYTLTTAHLNHRPADCRPSNLRALCTPCHGRFDLAQMALKRSLKREREGQLSLALS